MRNSLLAFLSLSTPREKDQTFCPKCHRMYCVGYWDEGICTADMHFPSEPTARGDRIAEYMREWYETNRESWSERFWKQWQYTSDNFMIRLMNEMTRIDGAAAAEQGTQSNPWRDAPAWAIELRNIGADIRNTLATILQLQVNVMSIIDDLEAGVAEQTTVIGGFEQLMKNYAEAKEAAGNDNARLAAVDAAFRSNSARLGALLAANTAAAPEAVASPAAPEITEETRSEPGVA